MPIERSQVIQLMRKAFRKGQSASSFITAMKARGLSYRRATMLGDWRSINELEKKEGALRFVRRDRYPTGIQEAKNWQKMKFEYMYKVKVHSRISPDKPMAERFVNLMSDIPLTPRQIEQQVETKWVEWEKYAPEELVDLQAWTAIHRVLE